ncbi:hypothetical protein CBR_g12616 [Chara braunii]|uniref:Uncharacterized protein n=1 Tax=Chara braunii TaxID=69332 RepID=A0A388KS80_CHABU|nr:hypothetical protein CBR_g12616 [Chara braunii]|eukprot:GBG72896.1 hypothetical protein CBR_g12616 [Chara braunii]
MKAERMGRNVIASTDIAMLRLTWFTLSERELVDKVSSISAEGVQFLVQLPHRDQFAQALRIYITEQGIDEVHDNEFIRPRPHAALPASHNGYLEGADVRSIRATNKFHGREVSHSFAASGHGQGGVLDDARRASVGDTHDRNSARRSLVSRFDEDDIVCGSGNGPGRCDPGAQNLGASRSEHSGGSLGQFGSQSTGSAKYSRLFLTTACKERLRLLQSAMKEVSDKSGVMSDVVDRLLHWSLSAIRSEFGDGVASRIEKTLPADSRADVFRLGAGGDDSTADAEDDGEREGEGSGGGNGGSFCGTDDSVPRSGHGSQRGRKSCGRPPSHGRSRSHFEHVRPLCWDDSRDGALQSGPRNNRLQQQLFHATVTAGMTYTILNDFCIAFGVAPVHKPTLYSCMRGEPNVREGWNAKVVRQSVRYCDLTIDTVMRSGRPVTLMVDGRYDSARSAQHCTVTTIECDTRLVFTKELLDALTERYGLGSLTAKEERLKKSNFVALVMSKMYPFAEMRAATLSLSTMMIADHWAGDHSRCVAERELLCSKAGDPSRLPLYTHDDPVYDIIRQTLGRHSSTTVCSYYTEFRHTSTVETFQGTIIIYAKKALHFEKSYEPRLAIAVIRWNNHAWQDPLEYRVRRPSGTSIRQRPSHYCHNRPPTDSWMDRLSTFIFGSKCVSDRARRLFEYDDCDVSGEVGSSTPPLPRDFFCRGEDTIARDEDDVASGAEPDVVGDDDVFIIGDGDLLPGPADAVFDRSCDSLSDADDVELFDDLHYVMS